MRYALLVSYDDTAEISAAERSRRAAGLASASARLRSDSSFGDGLWLQPASTGATVRCWDGGDVMVSPGPATAAREQLAACFVIDCSGTDDAIKVATSIPAAWYGSVEVRPVAVGPDELSVAIPQVSGQVVVAPAAAA
jgi:hypothetical protein